VLFSPSAIYRIMPKCKAALVHQSVVESVLSKIPTTERQSISKELLLAANDKFRLLSVKAAQPGQLGKGDSQESRAALILEHVVRMDGSRQKLGLGTLAKVVGVNRTNLEALQLKMENYLTEKIFSSSNITTLSTTGMGRKSGGKSSLSRSKSTNSSTASFAARSCRSEEQTKVSSIPQLSIKLGSIVQDSHGVCKRAQTLYKDIQDHIQTSSTINEHLRQDHLTDWVKYQTAYEAACFFIISTNAEKSAKTESSLHFHDVLNASGVSSLLWRQILPTAEAFQCAVEGEKMRKLEQSRKRGRGDRVSNAAQKKIKSTGGNADGRAKQTTRNATNANILNLVNTWAKGKDYSVPLSTTAWPRELHFPPLPLDYVTKRDEIVNHAIENIQAKARLENGKELSQRDAKRRACHDIITTLSFHRRGEGD